jgi:excisionase family DNA binding protein
MVFLNIKDVCSLLAVSKSFIYKKIVVGEILAYKIGRGYKIKDVDLENYLLKNKTFQNDIKLIKNKSVKHYTINRNEWLIKEILKKI